LLLVGKITFTHAESVFPPPLTAKLQSRAGKYHFPHLLGN